MKKHFKKFISLILVVAMIFTAIPQASAAQKKYVSDMKISYDADGKQKLTDAGYTVIKQNLNQDANNGALKANREVYIGYKTTFDPTEAITDIAMMSEECGYSFSDYQEMMKAQFAKYEILAEKEMDVIKEFRANYKNKSPLALPAYESLNNFREDDSGKLVGDYLLDESLTMDDLFKFITQISSYTLTTINNVLATGVAEYTNENFLTRLSALSNKEIEASKADHTLYDNAMIFYDQMQVLKNNIKEAEGKNQALENATEEELKNSEENLTFITNHIFITEKIKTVKFGEKILYDVIMNNDLSVEDMYPLVKVMTPGQTGIVGFSGFSQLFLTTNEIAANEVKEAQESVATEVEKPEVISAYFGVDRAMFTDAVAVTSKATRKMSATGDSSPMWGNVASGTEIALAVTAGVSAVTAITAMTTLIKLGKYVQSGASTKMLMNPKIVTRNLRVVTAAKDPLIKGGLSAARFLVGLSVVMYVAIAVMVIVSLVLMILELYNYYNPVYSKVPKILLDLYDENDQSKYIRYDGVMGLDGEMGDVNGYVGKKWNAIYVTKDPSVGKPIEANTLSFSDSSKMTDKNYKPIHSFGDPAAVNLNNYTFSGSRQIYLYFKQDITYKPASTLPGSIFSNTNANLAVLTGIVGAGVGFAVAFIFFRRRKKEDITPTITTSGQ